MIKRLNRSNFIDGMEILSIQGSELTFELNQFLLIWKGKEYLLVLMGMVVKECLLVLKRKMIGISKGRVP